MYKALIEIGDYKEGQIVPDELAETWLQMYLVAPVIKIESVPEKQVQNEIPKSQSEQEKSEVTSGNLLEDYLGRNTNVVVKNIETDNLNQTQLKELLKLEKSGKKRSPVIRLLEKKLEEKK